MPWYPYSSVAIFVFLIFIAVVLFLAKDTREALLVTPVWFVILLVIYQVKYRRTKKRDFTEKK
jgi:D-serine/D-alanine/glycine transporter